MMKGKKIRLIAPLLTTVLLFTATVPCAVLAGDETHVVILCTSDMHGNVLGYSYEDNTETKNNGMARLYTYISQVREENPVVFLVDAGDDIQGTIMTDEIVNKQPEREHPVMTAMNYMGYDVMTVGNHEFNWGVETLKKIMSQAAFPVLSANILNPDGTCLTGHGWTIVEHDGVKLAVNNFRYSASIKAKNLAAGKRDWESSNSIRGMIVEYFRTCSPVAPETDHNWRITGVDLSKDDPRRAEIIAYINEGLLATPYDVSYNLADYDALVAEAEANRSAGIYAAER